MALHRVFIPVVDADLTQSGAAEDRLWEVYCGPASADDHVMADKQLSKDWTPTVARLREAGGAGRYNSGLRAYMAVERLLAAQTAKFALDNRRLRSEGGEWVKAITGNSSDLGLALCLLLDATRSRTKTLAATGALANAEDNKDADDLLVEPVGGVQAKLRLIIERKRSGRLPDDLERVIIPEQHLVWHGEPRRKVAEKVENLPEVKELEALGIRVCPVASLAEAARVAGADINVGRLGGWDLGLRVAGGLLAAAAAVAFYALTGEVKMEWETIPTGAELGPYLRCPAPDGGKPRAVKTARGPQQLPELPLGADLAWQVRVGNAEESQQWPYRFVHALGYQGYHLAMVMVGRQTGWGADADWVPAAKRDNKSLRVEPGGRWAHHWVQDQTAETGMVVLLVRRFGAFDLESLRKGFNKRFDGDPKNLDFAAVEQYLRGQADGGLKFIFTSKAEAKGCDSD